MTVYKVTKRDPISKTKSFQYFTGISKAVSIQRKYNKITGVEDDVEEINFNLTKKDVCALLNKLQ